MSKPVLSIDTSNYTTSLGLTDEAGNCLKNVRRLLPVEEGKKGLRQSDALFKHVKALPELMEEMLPGGAFSFSAVAVADKPRPEEGSYMPCFLAGVSLGRSIAAVQGIPLLRFSHQEGHFAAATKGTGLEGTEEPYLAFHLSGGTTELVHVDRGMHRIVGGTLDISAGQLLDRLGVALGAPFPCGAYLDALAVSAPEKADFGLLAPIHTEGSYLNLSGLETGMLRLLEKGAVSPEQLAATVFAMLSKALLKIAGRAAKETGCRELLFSGGVSSSRFLRQTVSGALENGGLRAHFGDPALSTDNAVGIGILGGRALWQENR